ncbi:MAG: DUF1801 domain-containing protein [Alphaproteobacteria bacterium]|nr:hypothetical protein [Hyphomonas sp.]MBR9808683.1 DUF1801 domain-containing protein [Alphaproteobacteria bacterium]
MTNKTETLPAPADVQAVFETYPLEARKLLLALRQLVFETAARLPDVGRITETLKWGEPAYLTTASKSGTTIRLAWSSKRPDSVGLFVNCQTTLLKDWRWHYEDELTLVGNREIRFALDKPLPEDALRHCIAMALTYHKRKAA